jgi:hypothetical protein
VRPRESNQRHLAWWTPGRHLPLGVAADIDLLDLGDIWPHEAFGISRKIHLVR